MVKRALVCGAGGFIGGHLVKKLKREGYWVRGVDIKAHGDFDVLDVQDDLLDTEGPVENGRRIYEAQTPLPSGADGAHHGDGGGLPSR
jgi:nucleoside-diphosphate-sugar epimerase